jgi:hypothetical protein
MLLLAQRIDRMFVASKQLGGAKRISAVEKPGFQSIKQ